MDHTNQTHVLQAGGGGLGTEPQTRPTSGMQEKGAWERDRPNQTHFRQEEGIDLGTGLH